MKRILISILLVSCGKTQSTSELTNLRLESRSGKIFEAYVQDDFVILKECNKARGREKTCYQINKKPYERFIKNFDEHLKISEDIAGKSAQEIKEKFEELSKLDRSILTPENLTQLEAKISRYKREEKLVLQRDKIMDELSKSSEASSITFSQDIFENTYSAVLNSFDTKYISLEKHHKKLLEITQDPADKNLYRFWNFGCFEQANESAPLGSPDRQCERQVEYGCKSTYGDSWVVANSEQTRKLLKLNVNHWDAKYFNSAFHALTSNSTNKIDSPKYTVKFFDGTKSPDKLGQVTFEKSYPFILFGTAQQSLIILQDKSTEMIEEVSKKYELGDFSKFLEEKNLLEIKDLKHISTFTLSSVYNINSEYSVSSSNVFPFFCVNDAPERDINLDGIFNKDKINP